MVRTDLLDRGEKLPPQQPDSVFLPKPSRRGWEICDQTGASFPPSVKTCPPAKGNDLTGDVTFLPLHTIATLCKKSEQHPSSTYHVPITSSSQGSSPCPGRADTSYTFSSPDKSPEKAHCPTCSKQILPVSHPKPAPPPPAEGVVLITLLQTTCSCSRRTPGTMEETE